MGPGGWVRRAAVGACAAAPPVLHRTRLQRFLGLKVSGAAGGAPLPPSHAGRPPCPRGLLVRRDGGGAAGPGNRPRPREPASVGFSLRLSERVSAGGERGPVKCCCLGGC